MVILGQILFNFLTPERRTSKIQRPRSNERQRVHSSRCSIVVRFANSAAIGGRKSATRAREALVTNLDCRSVRCNPPKFLDLFVGNCDATGGPIFPAMKRADPAASILISVNHDVRAGRNAMCSRTLVVFIRRIRNVQRETETALRISAIDLVDPFRRFHVAFLLLRA